MLYQVGYLAYFSLNQDEIIAEYCINKDKPELECNGHCHLKKEIQKVQVFQDDDQRENERLPQIELEFLIAIFPDFNQKKEVDKYQLVESIWDYNSRLCCADSNEFWHPPKV